MAEAHLAIYGSAWTALVCWAISNWMRTPFSARLLWTAGCLTLVGHVALAFHFVHHWRHESAYAAVAVQTYAQTGLDSGMGVYVNYTFALFWLADTAIWWLTPAAYGHRPRWRRALVQFVFLFMFVNATVVFGTAPARLLGAIGCAGAVVGWLRNEFARTRAEC